MNEHYPPGPDGGPSGIVNLIRYQKNLIGFLAEISQRYGDIVYFQLPNTAIYLLNHPKLVKQVYLNNWQQLRKPEAIKTSLRGHWGDGLASLDGKPWQHKKRLMQPAFYHHHITRWAETIVACTQEMLAHWHSGQVIDIYQEMLTLRARIAVRTLFDAELEGYGTPNTNKERAGIIPLQEAIGINFMLTQENSHFPFLGMSRPRAAETMENTVKLIKNRFAHPENRGDMLSFFLEARYEDGSKMSLAELIDELIQMFFAGHLTTATWLTQVWYMLWHNPDVETKLHQELKQVLNSKNPSSEDLPNLPYVEMIINETGRFYPPAPILYREVDKAFQVDDYTLEKGASVWISPYLLHYDSRNFTQPKRFWPARFSPENIKQIPKYVYLPFGAGPRICIAKAMALLEMRLILATAAQTYRLSLAPEQSVSPQALFAMQTQKTLLMQVQAHPLEV